MMSTLSLEELVLKLFDVNGLKFGNFTVRTGEFTPIYIDMRVIWTYPDLVRGVAEHILMKLKTNDSEYEMICGIPYQGIPLASHISLKENIPMLLKRKSPKKYGTCKLFEGTYEPGTKVALIDDVIMTGGTLVEDVPVFQSEGLSVTGVYCFFDRNQGGCERVKHVINVPVHCVLTIVEAFDILLKAGKVKQSEVDTTMEYIRTNRFDTPENGCPAKEPATNGSEENGNKE